MSKCLRKVRYDILYSNETIWVVHQCEEINYVLVYPPSVPCLFSLPPLPHNLWTAPPCKQGQNVRILNLITFCLIIRSSIFSLDKLQEGHLVYECNSMCKCDATCPNRVLQKGIQVKLEIFRTEKKVNMLSP